MAALSWDDLTEPERTLSQGAHAGTRVSFQADDAASNNPSSGAEWAPARQVRAALLRELLVGGGDPAHPVHAHGVQLQGARITGTLDFEAATLRFPLTLRNCYFDSALSLENASAPALRLSGSHVPGVNARELTVRGDLRLDDGFTCAGEASVAGATIGGDLVCRDGHFSNPNGIALDGYALTVAQTMFCCDGFSAKGEVRLEGAHIGGALLCANATLTSPERPALRADLLRVDQGMACNESFIATGEMRLIGAHIQGQLMLSGGRFVNRAGPSINAAGITVDRGMICCDGFDAQGEVRLVGARIGAELNCLGGAFDAGSERALDMTRATVDGAFFFRPERFAGGLDLTHATIGGYYDDRASWPEWLDVDGLEYDSIEAAPPITVADRLQWLMRNNHGSYSSQPYEQLATCYRRQGLDDNARIVAIAKQRRRRAKGGLLDKVSGWLLDLTVGYGYRTWLAVLWLAGLIAIGTFVFWLAYPDHMAAARPDRQPPFHPLVYALDVLLPVVTLHLRDAWYAQGIYEGVFVVLTVAGWVLASAVVLSLTGVLKRD